MKKNFKKKIDDSKNDEKCCATKSGVLFYKKNMKNLSSKGTSCIMST